MTPDPSPLPAPPAGPVRTTPRWLRALSRAALVCVAIAFLFMLGPMLKGAYDTAFPPEPVPADQLPAWRDGFSAALAESAETGKPVLVDFTAAWCPPCKVMEAETWPDEGVRAVIAERVIPLQLDVDDPSSAAASRRYGVRSIPTLLLIDASGAELARGGFMSADALTGFITEHAPAAARPATDS